MYVIQWVRSLLFIIQMYIAMVVIGVAFLIPMIFHAKYAVMACRTFSLWVIWTMGWMVNIKSEVRGTPPTGQVVIAAKHQSFLDILMIFAQIPWGKFVMKKQLMYAPILGIFARRLGCIPVDRGKRSQAVKQMIESVKKGEAYPGQLVIYPQGTRVAPGDKKPYKAGTAAIYQATGQPCVPVAVNVGVFWPKRGIMRHPGTAVIEFMDTIEPGLGTEEFMQRLEAAIEPRSNELMAEAGFEV